MNVCSPLKLLYHVKHVFDKMRGVSLRTNIIKSIFFDVNVPNLPTYVFTSVTVTKQNAYLPSFLYAMSGCFK